MATVPRTMGVHDKICSTSPVGAARCHTGSPLSSLDMRLHGTQESSPKIKEYVANDATECFVQRVGCSISQLRRRWSPPSPTPILIPEEPEHPAGIGHRRNSQEILQEIPVSCLRSSCTKSCDGFKDLVCGFVPDKRLWVFVMLPDKAANGVLQFLGGAVDATS